MKLFRSRLIVEMKNPNYFITTKYSLAVWTHDTSINIFRGQQIIGPPKKKSANKFVQEMFDAAKE